MIQVIMQFCFENSIAYIYIYINRLGIDDRFKLVKMKSVKVRRKKREVEIGNSISRMLDAFFFFFFISYPTYFNKEDIAH